MQKKDDLQSELQHLVGALRNHVANERDAYNPVSRLILKGAELPRREEGKEDHRTSKAVDRAGVRRESLSLAGVREELGDCTRCPLHRTRRNLVFGEGSTGAKLVFVGEAPGEEEDNQGRPFVGRAGQLLTKIISAMGLAREDVYICTRSPR